MISNQSPYRNPSGLSAQGLSEGQLSEAAHYFLANLERLLNANLDTLTEVILLHMMTAVVKDLNYMNFEWFTSASCSSWFSHVASAGAEYSHEASKSC